MVPLCFVRNSKQCYVCRARGKGKERMEALGFVPGEPIEIVSSFDGNVIVCLRGVRYALDKEQSKNIIVEESE